MKNRSIFILFFFLCTWGAFSQPYYFNENTARGFVDSEYGIGLLGGGISFYDYDNDGWDDITLATQAGDDIKIFHNNNGSYQEVSLNGISVTCESKSVVWVDIDNDGDNDLFVTCYDDSNKLFINDGNLNFNDIAENSAFELPDHKTWGVSFADYDKDGDLDFFICSRNIPDPSEHNILIRNNGDGTFTDVTATAGISQTNHLSFTSAFFDFNNDGWQDIFIANDKFTTENQLYMNNGDGTFTDVAQSAGVDHAIDGMSTSIGDFNKDGFFDIYVTNTPSVGNLFLKNNGDETFTDIAQNTNTQLNSFCWGSTFLDTENNGLLDIYVSTQYTNSNSLPNSAFFKNFDNGNFANITSAMVNDNFQSYSNAIGDVNNDGYPDIVTLNFSPDDSSLWINQAAENENHWLQVELKGTTSNHMGIGAKLKLKTPNNTQYNYTLCGEGYIAQNSGKEFFGLGTESTIDYLKVTWPSGIVDSIPDITPDQRLTVEEGSGILSVDTIEDGASFNIIPNPADDHISIRSDQGVDEIDIYDISGKIMLRSNSLDKDKLSIEELPAGIYFVKARINERTITKKLIKR